MKNFALYFTKRWTFIFPDVCKRRCVAFVNRTRRTDPKTFVLFRKIGKDSGGSVS